MIRLSFWNHVIGSPLVFKIQRKPGKVAIGSLSLSHSLSIHYKLVPVTEHFFKAMEQIVLIF